MGTWCATLYATHTYTYSVVTPFCGSCFAFLSSAAVVPGKTTPTIRSSLSVSSAPVSTPAAIHRRDNVTGVVSEENLACLSLF